VLAAGRYEHCTNQIKGRRIGS